MSQIIRINKTGAAEVMKLENYEPGKPAKGEVLIEHTAIGLNFIDTYHRNGLYPHPAGELPASLGLEAAGIVKEVGPEVVQLKKGDRVAYGTGPIGAYCKERVIPADKLLKLPDEISDKTAASMMLRGMTVQYLLRQTYNVQPSDTILVHAAAGGIGRIMCQWAKFIGATVIGTVSTQEKAELAQQDGCKYPVLYTKDDFVEKVAEITNGQGVAAVYDGVGKDTFEGSLKCLQPRGTMVTFGNASGPVPPVSPLELTKNGSIYLTRPSLMHYTATRKELEDCAHDLFSVVKSGAVKIHTGQEYKLENVVQAHKDIETRKTTGSTILIP